MVRWISLLPWLFGLATAVQQRPLQDDSRPNIVFIITDDQDLHLDSIEYMPLLQKHVIQRGTTFQRHYCTIAVCCPSRVSLWTGKAAHNTNVTDVVPPYGGYPKFVSQGLNDNFLPVWLQEAGYSTFYTGKLFNAHSVDNYNSPFVKGFTSAEFLLDPYTYQYLDPVFQRNRDPPKEYKGQYNTDVLGDKAYGLLEEAVAGKKPFMLTVAPIAPHANFALSSSPDGHSEPLLTSAPIPATRHEHLFPDVKVPRRANFNPDKASGVGWVKSLAQLNDTIIEYNDNYYRARLQALQAVDEIVEGIVSRLDAYGILNNTYIAYSTDNGYHISQHRLPPGKTCGFEEDINIPFIIRGPGIEEGAVSDVVTSHTDLAPTFLHIAGARTRDDFDGSIIPLHERSKSNGEHVNVEFWGRSLAEGDYKFYLDDGEDERFLINNTYKALRIIGDSYNLYYSVWCTNEHELYDLSNDPYQLDNLYLSDLTTRSLVGHPAERVIERLDLLLLVLKSCKGDTCREPWKVLHPRGDVQNLQDALKPGFDSFYKTASANTRVEFSRCELGYLIEAEGPQKPPVFPA